MTSSYSSHNDNDLLIAAVGPREASLFGRHDNLAQFFSASQSEKILAIKELTARLWVGSPDPPEIVGGAARAYEIFRDLAREDREVVAAGFLDCANRLLRRKVMFIGNLQSSVARPREILREALRVNAARLLIAHNHPSNVLEPSLEDLRFTARVVSAAQTLGVPLLDHLIIGKESYFSFAEAKLLNRRAPRIPGLGRRSVGR